MIASKVKAVKISKKAEILVKLKGEMSERFRMKFGEYRGPIFSQKCKYWIHGDVQISKEG